LGFGGKGKGKKDLWRGKPLFGSFKKIGKDFGGLNIQIDNFVLIIIQNSNYNLQDKLQSITQYIDFKRKKKVK